MAGLPWVKVATDFVDHPKALALATRLADPRAPLYLPAIWGHVARHYADGAIPDTDDAIRALERAARWPGPHAGLVDALVEVALLHRRRRRLVVHGWDEWQEGHTRKLERDRDRMRAKRAEVRARAAPEHAQQVEVAEGGSRDGRAKEETERRGDGEETPSASPREVAAAPPEQRPLDVSSVVLVLPCTGTGARAYSITETQATKWSQAFPGVDVLGELRKAHAWLEANPTKVKTHRGMPAFCVRWLSKAQDDRRSTGRPASTPPPGRRPGMAPMGTAEAFARDEKPWDPEPAPVRCAEWAAVLAEHDRLPPDEQRRGIRELDVLVRDGALVLRARDRFDAERLREWWAPGISKLAENALGRRVAVLVDDPGRNLQVGPAAPAPPEAFVGGDRSLA